METEHSEGANGQEFQRNLQNWYRGNINSVDFFPILIKEVFTRNLHIGPTPDQSVHLSDYSVDDFIIRAKESEYAIEARQWGVNKVNPPMELIRKRYYSFIDKFGRISRRNEYLEGESLTKLDLETFRYIDPKLLDSIILHSYVANITGSKYEPKNKTEKDSLDQYYNAVFNSFRDKGKRQELPEGVKSDAGKIHLWLQTEGLLSAIREFKVRHFLPYIQDKIIEKGQIVASNPKWLFSSEEAFFKRYAPIEYLTAWEEHIDNRRYQFRESLPDFLSDKGVRSVVLTTYFLHQSGNRFNKPELLENVLRSIRTTGNAEEAKQMLVELCVKKMVEEKVDPPAYPWQQESAKIDELIKEKIAETIGLAPEDEETSVEFMPEVTEPLDSSVPQNIEQAQQLDQQTTELVSNEAIEIEGDESTPLNVIEERQAIPDNNGSSSEVIIEDREKLEKSEPTPSTSNPPPPVQPHFRTERIRPAIWDYTYLEKYLHDAVTKNRQLFDPNSYPKKLILNGPLMNVINILRQNATSGGRNIVAAGFQEQSSNLQFSIRDLQFNLEDQTIYYAIHALDREAKSSNFITKTADIQNVPRPSALSNLMRRVTNSNQREPNFFTISHLYRMLADPNKPIFTGFVTQDTSYLLFRTNKTPSIDINSSDITLDWFRDYWQTHFGNSQPDYESIGKEIIKNHELVLYKYTANNNFERM